jgi:caffeoyl-CoA O-methyltransferase
MNEVEKYCINQSHKEDDLLKEVKEFTYQNESAPQMISGSLVCNTLLMFIKMIKARRVLEIGMFTGYSSLYMAQGLPEDGEIHTCEIMERHINTATNFFNQSKYKDNIFIHPGNAMDTLENFKINSFDLVFIDADKKNYIEYYNRSIQLIKSGGIIVLDNMLWGGTVLNPKDLESKILNKLSKFISEDLRVINLLLPIRDGIMVCIKQ